VANYTGADSFTYTVTSPAGVTETATVSVTAASVKKPPVFIPDKGSTNSDGQGSTVILTVNSSNDNRPSVHDNAAVNALPATLPEFTALANPALHVLFSVGDARSESELRAGLGLFETDSVTSAELLDGLAVDLAYAEGNQAGSKGLGGYDRHSQRPAISNTPNSLFVQHAVRHQVLGQEHSLFVQDSVRSSQLESLARNLRVASFNSATSGVSTLFDPFALGAPVAGGLIAASDVEIQKSEVLLPEIKTGSEPDREVGFTAPGKPAPQTETPTRLPLRRAAEGFGAQLQRSATSFRPRMVQARGATTGAADAQ
jgi:hypothetical protein